MELIPAQYPDQKFLQKGPFTTLAALRDFHTRRAPAEWFFKPVSLELELTERCNLRCPGCAVIEEVERGLSGFSVDEALALIGALGELGVYGVGLTGGEVFLRFADLCAIIERSPVEVFKILTNGSLFRSFEQAERLLTGLRDAGFATKNRFLVPRIGYSIGMQTEEGVELSHLVFFTYAFLKVFGESAHFVINVSTATLEGVRGCLADLDVAYRRLVGVPYPIKSMLVVNHFGLDYTLRLSDLSRVSERTSTLEDRVRALPPGYVCTNFKGEHGPVPRVLIRADGTLYPCSCFGHAASPGSVKTASIRALLERVNQDEDLKTVVEGGLPALLAKVQARDPTIPKLEIPVKAGICKVCKALREPHRPLYETVSTRAEADARDAAQVSPGRQAG
ncbi:MAG: radical SAM protein [Deltaproteobacteria bacterium]|nr:radical SAM protein [Deltaproteobacteria bacterium]